MERNAEFQREMGGGATHLKGDHIEDKETVAYFEICPDFFFLIYLIYLFLAVLSLRCCAWAFSSCGEQGLLIVVASLVVEHGL